MAVESLVGSTPTLGTKSKSRGLHRNQGVRGLPSEAGRTQTAIHQQRLQGLEDRVPVSGPELNRRGPIRPTYSTRRQREGLHRDVQRG